MCGRFVQATPVAELARLFGFGDLPNLPPRWNVAPTQDIAAVTRDADGQRHLQRLRWGLVPAWAREPGIGAGMINARADGVAEKPAFRSAFRTRRCLIPADGFYEWQAAGGRAGRKQPVYILPADRAAMPVLAFAGLWESWTGPASAPAGAAPGGPLRTATIITTDANGTMCRLHDRMPVVLDPADWAAWLDPATAPRDLLALLRPAPEHVLTLRPVSPRVNSVHNEGADLIQPAPPPVDEAPRLL